MVRLKTRYLVVELAGGPKLAVQREDIQRVVRDSIAQSHGDYGVGLLNYAFQVVYYNAHTRLAVIRCARELCKLVEVALVFVTDLQSQDAKIRVVRVCGSSRSCRQHMLKLSKERVERLGLHSVYPRFPAELEAEIAAIDPQ